MGLKEEDMNLVPESNLSSEVKILPLVVEKALASFSEEEKAEVLSLSEAIDVTKLENVMGYGSQAIKTNFEQCGSILKDERRI